jgi:hypothetical protein
MIVFDRNTLKMYFIHGQPPYAKNRALQRQDHGE